MIQNTDEQEEKKTGNNISSFQPTIDLPRNNETTPTQNMMSPPFTAQNIGNNTTPNAISAASTSRKANLFSAMHAAKKMVSRARPSTGLSHASEQIMPINAVKVPNLSASAEVRDFAELMMQADGYFEGILIQQHDSCQAQLKTLDNLSDTIKDSIHVCSITFAINLNSILLFLFFIIYDEYKL